MDNTQLALIIGGVVALVSGAAVFVKSMVNRTLTSHETHTKALTESIHGLKSAVQSLALRFARVEGKLGIEDDETIDNLRMLPRAGNNERK
jgi:hypothetical protein